MQFMMIGFRHLFGRWSVFRVVALVLVGVVSGALHAAAMAQTVTSAGSQQQDSECAMVGHPIGNHCHQAVSVDPASSGSNVPAHLGDMKDRCCPVSCSIALCPVASPAEAVFIREVFKTEPVLGLVIAGIAAPERPPRA